MYLADSIIHGRRLAQVYSDPAEELRYLAFSGSEIQVPRRRRESFLATVLVDLAALTGDREFYRDVLHETMAANAAYEFISFRDTPAQFGIEGEGMIRFPNIEFDENPSTLSGWSYGNHLADADRAFRVHDAVGIIAHLLLSSLMRDRYFPTLWPAPPAV
ncbi:MAG TPA: hypothetical protein VN934_05880 [Candidatus Tumulicola sp.]|nr:hypothetical protein [Candidatus Tumulicola sp.]